MAWNGEALDGFIAAKSRRCFFPTQLKHMHVKLDHFPGRGVHKKNIWNHYSDYSFKCFNMWKQEGNMLGVRKSLSTLLPQKKILTVHTNTKTQSDTVLQESFLFNIFKSKKSDLYRTTMKSDRESLATIPPTHRKQKKKQWTISVHILNSSTHTGPTCCHILSLVWLLCHYEVRRLKTSLRKFCFFTQSVELHDVLSLRGWI